MNTKHIGNYFETFSLNEYGQLQNKQISKPKYQ